MIPTQADVDLWHATVHRLLEHTQTAVLDLIDCGAPDRYVPGRRPSDRDLEATGRSPSGHDQRGADLFDPTPKTQGRRQGGVPSDPVGRAVIAWEAEVQAAVLAVFEVVSAVDDIGAALGLSPHDEHGDPLDAPREPATSFNGNGRLVVVDHPRLCRLATLDASRWLAAIVDQLADRMRGVTDPDVGDHLAERADTVKVLVVRLGRQVDARPASLRRDHPATVRCACGSLAKYRQLQRCDTCRRRELRAS